jgi:hypothetical protein
MVLERRGRNMKKVTERKEEKREDGKSAIPVTDRGGL